MQHCTPEQLALAALREPLPEEDQAHLAGCGRCRAEVTSLRRSVDALAVPQLAAPGAGVAPPPAVWTAIATATDVTAAPRPERIRGDEPTATTAPPAAERPPEDATVLPLPPARARRSLRGRLLLIAASLVAGIGIGAGAVALRDLQGGGDTVVAAPLRPIGAGGATGTATVVQRGDARVLEVSIDAPTLSTGYYEVWLAEPDLQHMVAVGVLHDGKGELDLPAGLDLSSYRVIDVSAEPLDGDPAHSAVSVARGQLAR